MKKQAYQDEDYDYEDYTIADGSDDLSWYLLFSRKSAKLPLVKFSLTEELPCTMDGTFQVKTDVIRENFLERTKDPYMKKCPLHFDKYLSPSYRSASPSITVNEMEWLTEIGAKQVVESLPYSPGKERYFEAKSLNELQLWQRSIEPWNESCAETQPFKSSVSKLNQFL